MILKVKIIRAINLVRYYQNQNFKPKSRNFKPKNKGFKDKPKLGQLKGNKKNSDEMFCYVCGRDNHLAIDCYHRKKEKVVTFKKGNSNQSKSQVNMIDAGLSDPTFRLVCFVPLAILPFQT